MDQFKPPSQLVLTGNLAENWRRWEQRFQLYMTATGASVKEEQVKIAILLHTIGEEALEVYNTLTIHLVDEENETMEDVLTAFRDYCSPQKNFVFERHQFWSHPMADGITVDRFITELKQKSKVCEFGPGENDMLRDKLVFSITNPSLKERLLRENDLSLHRAIEICRATELAKTQIKAMQNAAAVQDSQVNAIDRVTQQRKPGASSKSCKKPATRNCRRCGKSHEPRQCPAFGAVCHKCGKGNHFAKICHAASRNDSRAKTVHSIMNEIDSMYIGTSQMHEKEQIKDSAWYMTATIRGIEIRFKLDTGAKANVLPLSVVQKIPGPVKPQPTSTVLIAFGGMRSTPKGVVTEMQDP